MVYAGGYFPELNIMSVPEHLQEEIRVIIRKRREMTKMAGKTSPQMQETNKR